MVDSFPRQQARTRRFSLGVPRTFTVSADGATVLFLRSASGTDPETSLWAYDVVAGEERLLADPAALRGGYGDDLTAEERARRERRRERAAGIVAYSTDEAVTTAVFVAAGGLWAVDVATGALRALSVPGPVFDPRLDAAGGRIAWCCGDDLWVATVDGSDARLLAGADGEDGEDGDGIVWGQAEFVAAEEMGRDRGHWWLPGDAGLLAARVDTTPVARWWIADPAHPDRPPVAHRYPAAGTADADVSLWVIDAGGVRTEVRWDRDAYPYLAAVTVDATDLALLVVERRDHTDCRVLAVDPSGRTSEVAALSDPAWVDWPPGLPRRLGDGRLVWAEERDGTTTLVVDGVAVTPAGLEVRAVVGVGDGPSLVFTGSEDPTSVALYRSTDAGTERISGDGVTTAAAVGGATVVVAGRVLERSGVTTRVVTASAAVAGVIRSLADEPLVTASVRMLEVGPDRLRTGVVLPSGHRPGTPLPVLVRPYGGPGAQMVLADQHIWLEAQWRADRGFAVVVCDGRGTPGRGPRWERRVHLDFASVLDDQVTALQAAAVEVPDLDLDRVGISGWSFGGYLSALAVLRRPDVFHAAVAGAPVTDWRLYDTYYTERYLGHPDTDPGVYDRSSLLDDAAALRRPLLVVHGLVDDNVVVAHTLRLSQRLVEAGRPHAVVPLTGVTHMASQEEVAENLLLLEMEFLARALGPG
jgi:dipeptidyl-peptidase-4